MEKTAGAPQTLPEDLDEESALSSHRVKMVIGLAILVSALGYFALMAFQSATVYFYTVDEIVALAPTEEGRMVRVSGKLVPDSFVRQDDSIQTTFALTGGDVTLLATHQGVLPDLFFNEHSEIILEGTYHGDGTFESHNVIVKCPSKYIAAG